MLVFPTRSWDKLGGDITVSAISNVVYLFINFLLRLTSRLQTLVSSNVVSVKGIAGVSLQGRFSTIHLPLTK